MIASDVVAVLRIAAASVRLLCEQPEALTVTEWAEKYRILPETSTSPGPYRVDVAPYQRRPQDLSADPSIARIVLCWGSQTGKSTVIEHAAGYRIHRAPTPIIVAQPKIDAAEAWAKERFVPMVRSTPVLQQRVQLGRSSDSTLRYKRFPGGFLFVASAHSATELASRSAPFVAPDEVDRFEHIPGEGNPVEILAKRQGAADVGLELMTSTPRDAESTIIWPYLEAGTFELFYLPCPHCGERQPLTWKRENPTTKKSVYCIQRRDDGAVIYACLNGCEIEEQHKPAMLRAGEWVATNPEGEYPSFHMNSLYSPYAKSSWAVLLQEWERAQGKPADLQVFVNTRLAELWVDTDSRVSASDLLTRLDSGMEPGVVPNGVGLITAGIDVQGNRLEMRVWAWGVGLESWLLDVVVLEGNPKQHPDLADSVWSKLNTALAVQYRHVSGQMLPIRAALIDSGYAATEVYRFADPRRRKPVRLFGAAKGVDGERIILGKPTVQGSRRVVVYPIGVDGGKDEFLRSQILEHVEGPGYVHLPEWAGELELEQLTAEHRQRRLYRGSVEYRWIKKKPDAPNEALDCRIYARAALDLVPDWPRHIAAWADKAAHVVAEPPADPPPMNARPPHDDDDDAPAYPVSRRRSSWMNWRKS